MAIVVALVERGTSIVFIDGAKTAHVRRWPARGLG